MSHSFNNTLCVSYTHDVRKCETRRHNKTLMSVSTLCRYSNDGRHGGSNGGGIPIAKSTGLPDRRYSSNRGGTDYDHNARYQQQQHELRLQQQFSQQLHQHELMQHRQREEINRFQLQQQLQQQQNNPQQVQEQVPQDLFMVNEQSGEESAAATSLRQVHWPQPLEIPDHIDTSTNVPRAFICKISREIMIEPTLVSVSGHSYDRSKLLDWHATGLGRDPLTRQPFELTDLSPNLALRELIEQWIHDYTSRQEEVEKELKRKEEAEAAETKKEAEAAVAAEVKQPQERKEAETTQKKDRKEVAAAVAAATEAEAKAFEEEVKKWAKRKGEVAVAETMKEAEISAQATQTQQLKEAEIKQDKDKKETAAAATAEAEAKTFEEAEEQRTDVLARNKEEQESAQFTVAVAVLVLGGALVVGGLVAGAMKSKVSQRFTLDASASAEPVEERIVEYERKIPFKGFSASHLFPNEPKFKRDDQSDVALTSKEGLMLPVGWTWAHDWSVATGAIANSKGTDKDGWMYAFNWGSEYAASAKLTHCVRRRIWHRTRENRSVADD